MPFGAQTDKSMRPSIIFCSISILSKSPQVLYLTLKSFHDIMRIFVYNGLLAIQVDRKIQ